MKKPLCMALCFMIGLSVGASIDDIPKARLTPQEATGTEFYDSMIQNTTTIKIYDTNELTPEIMCNRNGKIVVEKIVGEVTNYKLDGKILNCNPNNEGYISYKNVDGVKECDKVLTYFIYNPFTNEPDDVLTRLDFIIDNNTI